MSRSGYSDDYEHDWQWICWHGAVKSAFRGKRGQAFLKEMLGALDALPVKRLISNELIEEGEVCAIGSVGLKRNVDLSAIDPEDYKYIANTFGIARAMAQEIMYMNDEYCHYNETPEHRWQRMRDWIASEIKE